MSLCGGHTALFRVFEVTRYISSIRALGAVGESRMRAVRFQDRISLIFKLPWGLCSEFPGCRRLGGEDRNVVEYLKSEFCV